MTTQTTDRNIESFQIWPRGTSVQLAGDINSPDCEVKFNGDAEFRAPTPDERTLIERELRARIYFDRDVLCCQTSLVDKLFGERFESSDSIIGEDDIVNERIDSSDWEFEQCREYCDDEGIDHPSPNPFDNGEVREYIREHLLPVYDIASELESIAYGAENDGSDCVFLDVRLRLHDGSYFIHVGSADFDQDHRGAIGAASLCVVDSSLEDADYERLKESSNEDYDGEATIADNDYDSIAEELVDQCLDMIFNSGGAGDGDLDERKQMIEAIADEDIEGLEEWREACQSHSDDNPKEAYEWWLVSDWLASRLESIGELMIRSDYGDWWGRTGTGQGLIMDGTLQRIAATFD